MQIWAVQGSLFLVISGEASVEKKTPLKNLQELDEESVQLRMHMDREGKSHAMAKPEAVVGLGRASQVSECKQ